MQYKLYVETDRLELEQLALAGHSFSYEFDGPSLLMSTPEKFVYAITYNPLTRDAVLEYEDLLAFARSLDAMGYDVQCAYLDPTPADTPTYH